MLIFDDNTKAIILESIHTPTITDHFWVLDLNLLDYKLTELKILEEIIAPTVILSIEGFDFPLPANWNILVVDDESMILDVVELSEVAGREFRALVYGPTMPMAKTAMITVKNYFPSYPNVGPQLNKHQMLCHPISPDSWINISSSDTYNKYLKDKVVGDLL
jgi:hypothetical protein